MEVSAAAGRRLADGGSAPGGHRSTAGRKPSITARWARTSGSRPLEKNSYVFSKLPLPSRQTFRTRTHTHTHTHTRTWVPEVGGERPSDADALCVLTLIAVTKHSSQHTGTHATREGRAGRDDRDRGVPYRMRCGKPCGIDPLCPDTPNDQSSAGSLLKCAFEGSHKAVKSTSHYLWSMPRSTRGSCLKGKSAPIRPASSERKVHKETRDKVRSAFPISAFIFWL